MSLKGCDWLENWSTCNKGLLGLSSASYYCRVACVCAAWYVGELDLHLATLSFLRNNMQAEVDEEKDEIDALQGMMHESQCAMKEFLESATNIRKVFEACQAFTG